MAASIEISMRLGDGTETKASVVLEEDRDVVRASLLAVADRFYDVLTDLGRFDGGQIWTPSSKVYPAATIPGSGASA